MTFNLKVWQLPTLKIGSRNDFAQAWQGFLKDNGFPVGTIDGDFGNLTATATRNYQQKNNLPVTGIVDNTTYLKALVDGLIYKLPNFTANRLLDFINFGGPETIDLQKALNSLLNPDLVADGDFGYRSTQGLAEVYRQRDVQLRNDLEKLLSAPTKTKLGNDFAPALDVLTGYAKRLRLRLSGAHWINYFPTSRSLSDLTPPFRDRVLAFQKALVAAGAQTIISATYRPAERAYLMHYAASIDRNEIDPADVPPLAGVPIVWGHYTDAITNQEIAAMVDAYGIGGNPVALQSRHTQRNAIDWNVTWKGTISVKDSAGKVIAIGPPNDSSRNQILFNIGASYGVYKLDGDPPHWSTDGA
jgi:peptidoglycan hydrolase-like protein with peptidoglycan-binding domain